MRRVLGLALRGVVLGAVATSVISCSDAEKRRPSATQPISKYPVIALRQVPEYLKGTIYERANLQDTQSFLVSGYGLVVNLRGTGDNSAIPSSVREYMIKQMMVQGFGTHRIAGYEGYHPEQMLRDKRTSVVRVDGFVPPGIRKDEHFDVVVSALDESYTTSISHGDLYTTDLRYRGAESSRPAGSVNVYARAAGPIFVNPAYALASKKDIDPTAQASLRAGVVMDGGVSTFDNPLTLRVREPQHSTARAIERRIRERFQGVADKTNKLGELSMAAAQDEAVVLVYVPRVYRGNFEHFAGVVKHLYMNGDPAYLASMAEKLAAAAVQPDAPLENISYALEGIGQPASKVVQNLMKNPSPDVAYAAARAAAFIGDEEGEARAVLLRMANSKDHPFRLNAVRTLGDLAQSAETDQYLRQLVNSDNALVRVEAYKALIRPNRTPDPLVYSKVVQEKFVLDLVPSSGTPMIYCTRRGVPRIAMFGMRQSLVTPLTFSALDARLTLSADKTGGPVTLFYRAEKIQGDYATVAVRQASRPDLADIIARLGGERAPEEERLDFSYADVVGLLQVMNDAGKLTGMTLDGQPTRVLLVVEEQMNVHQDATGDAPAIPEVGREEDRGESTAPRIPDAAESPTTKASGGGAGPRPN